MPNSDFYSYRVFSGKPKKNDCMLSSRGQTVTNTILYTAATFNMLAIVVAMLFVFCTF